MTEKKVPQLSPEEHGRLLAEAWGSTEALHFFGRFHHRCGRIAGKGRVIKVAAARGPSKVSEETLELFGVSADEKCILITWIPADSVYGKGEVVESSPDWEVTKPRVTGTDPSQIPPEDELLDLPEVFEGLVVKYAEVECPYYDVEFSEDGKDE